MKSKVFFGFVPLVILLITCTSGPQTQTSDGAPKPKAKAAPERMILPVGALEMDKDLFLRVDRIFYESSPYLEDTLGVQYPLNQKDKVSSYPGDAGLISLAKNNMCTRIKIIIENKAGKDVDTEILGNVEMLFMDTESGSLELYDWIKPLSTLHTNSMRQKTLYRRHAKKEDYLSFLHPAGWRPVAMVSIRQNDTKSLLTISKEDPRLEQVNTYLENLPPGGSRRPLSPEDLFGKTFTGSDDGGDYSLVMQEDEKFIHTVDGTVSKGTWGFNKDFNASMYRYTMNWLDGSGGFSYSYITDFTEKRGNIYWKGQRSTYQGSVDVKIYTFSHFLRQLTIEETEPSPE
jgi:hypothetical protein